MAAVYPRWRGEHAINLAIVVNVRGLSPLARGTPRKNHNHSEKSRFIPAGAGNTRTSRTSTSAGAVYPRWRGEHLPAGGAHVVFVGLSPLARGTRPDPFYPPSWSRFIPAGAGNTPETGGRGAGYAVYPRWRGEHTDFVFVYSAELGLSPLARGTH